MAARRDALIARREALGHTQETLAEQLGVQPHTVGRWERGTLTPTPRRRPDLADVLKVTLEELDELLDSPPSRRAVILATGAMVADHVVTGWRGPAVERAPAMTSAN